MRNWIIGAVMVIAGGVLAMVLLASGVPKAFAAGTGLAVAVTGFAIQMFTAFRTKASFERSLRKAQQDHQELITRANSLPPDQAIKLLLGIK